MRRLLLPAALLSLFLCSSVHAQEDDPDGDAPAASETPGADEYTQRVQTGIAALVAGDTGGARSAFTDAIGMDGNRPMAPYYLAAANRMSGNLEDALSGFRRAAELAGEHPRWKGRALQGVAETLERIGGRLEDVRTAWQEYVSFADANVAVTFPQMGRARVSAVNLVIEQENAYVAVRERIAARERENAQSGSGESGSRRQRRRRRSR